MSLLDLQMDLGSDLPRAGCTRPEAPHRRCPDLLRPFGETRAAWLARLADWLSRGAEMADIGHGWDSCPPTFERSRRHLEAKTTLPFDAPRFFERNLLRPSTAASCKEPHVPVRVHPIIYIHVHAYMSGCMYIYIYICINTHMLPPPHQGPTFSSPVHDLLI